MHCREMGNTIWNPGVEIWSESGRAVLAPAVPSGNDEIDGDGACPSSSVVRRRAPERRSDCPHLGCGFRRAGAFPGFLIRFIAAFLLVGLSACGEGKAERDLANETTHPVETIEEELEYVRPEGEALSLLLSKHRYPAEDGHMDAVVWVGEDADASEAPGGGLRIRVLDSEGSVLSEESVAPIPGRRLFLAPPIPEELVGDRGILRIEWFDDGRRASIDREFEVAGATDVARSGRIPIRIANETGAAWENAPFTVGVPFPRGALADAKHTRLVDGEGNELPLQTKVTARWSRFGPVRWLQCDFTADLEGGPLEVFLEFGPDVDRGEAPDSLRVADRAESEEGFPAMNAGRLRLSTSFGVEFNPRGSDGPVVSTLAPEALSGAFLTDGEGRVFRMAEDAAYELEAVGPEKVRVKRTGWYVDEQNGERYCQYVTRYEIYRGSRMVRLLHTWIFTGDAYENRIGEMGWQLPWARTGKPMGFWSEFGGKRDFAKGDFVVQRDREIFDLGRGGEEERFDGEALGVFGVEWPDNGARLLVGNLEFARNYPRELAYEDGGMTFYEWPAHGNAPEHPEPHTAPNRLWFAHEGEEMDLALPREYSYDERILAEIAKSRRNNQGYNFQGAREYMVNAQGIAKTAELWLLFSDANAPLENELNILEGLESGTLQPVVDPEWLADSGAMGRIQEKDTEQFPEEEQVYDRQARAPLHWAERAHVYGKWLRGVVPHAPELNQRYQKQHRAFRKSHQGWPYSWLPFARSGDPKFFRYADAVTRFQTDIAFVHYSDERVPQFRDEDRARSRGWYTRNRIPWGHNRRAPTTRAREDKVHYLLDSYYLTGYPRAWDVAMDFAHLTKTEGVGQFIGHDGGWDARNVLDFNPDRDPRNVATMLRTWTEMYEATFDPWFLTAAHRTAEGIYRHYDTEAEALEERRKFGYRAFFYNKGDETYYRFTGDPQMGELIEHKTRHQTGQRSEAESLGSWSARRVGGAMILESLAETWRLTGDRRYLGRIEGAFDAMRGATYHGEPDYFEGSVVGAQNPAWPPMVTGWYLHQFPVALRAVADAGEREPPTPHAFYQTADEVTQVTPKVFRHRFPEIRFRKEAGESVPVGFHIQGPGGKVKQGNEFDYVVRYPDGRAEKGSWNLRRPDTFTVPADAPGGTYRVRVSGMSERGPGTAFHGNVPWLYLPLTPPDVPEVMVFENEDGEVRVGPASNFASYWFNVPEQMETLRVRFNVPRYYDKDHPLVRFTIWNPEREIAWAEEFDRSAHPGRTVVEAEVPIPEEHRGGMWRIYLPHERLQETSGGQWKPAFEIFGGVEPVFSVSPDRWFRPEE